ncbi:hypothetical protein EVAR_31193_1 [Eumeta japonica]|uniref:Uncharacterized protein n=1 Tax=Eumeta variegata TaxID=151549 RepID=A0A4C1VYI7_EUMVA|nr:hypothetical protein EVAR_31193_1 [Eumeta japonica]
MWREAFKTSPPVFTRRSWSAALTGPKDDVFIELRAVIHNPSAPAACPPPAARLPPARRISVVYSHLTSFNTLFFKSYACSQTPQSEDVII